MILNCPRSILSTKSLILKNSISKTITQKRIYIKIVVLAVFLFAQFNIVNAQVRIKEKVEIRPSPIQDIISKELADNEYFPCGSFIASYDLYNPWQIVWINSTYHLDVGQQPFSFQANTYDYRGIIDPTKYYDFVVTEGQNLCFIQEHYIDTVNGTYIPATDPGYELFSISGADMIGWLGDYEDPFELPKFQGVPTRGGFRKYSIYFNRTGDVTFSIKESESSDPPIYYHTKVVAPDIYLENYGFEEIPHGEEDDINIREIAVQCDGLWTYWNGGGLQEDIKYNVTITSGTEYGKLIKTSLDEDFLIEIRDTANSFTSLDDTRNLIFASDGSEPDDTNIVNIRYSTTDNSITPITKEIKIIKNKTYPIRVTMSPENILPGDTSFITIEKRVEKYPVTDPLNVDYEEFDSEQLFDVSIEDGEEYGTLFSIEENDTADSFSQISNEFYFIAKDTVNVNSADISIKVKAIILEEIGFLGKEANNSNQSILNKTMFIGIPSETTEIFGIGKVKVENELIEIMLGESKYFHAIYPDPSTNELVIEEVETDENGIPRLDGGLSLNVWGTDPISIVNESDTSGRKMGVYWETEKPVWNGTTNSGDLSVGLIRIVGRYWHQDSSYVVKLKAGRTNGDSADVNIRVVRPDSLGSNFGSINNCFQERFNLDSTITHFSGKFGIPPQIIKAQVHEESSFTPSLLYEPYKDIQYQNNSIYEQEIIDNQYFIEDESNEGTPSSPSNHHCRYWGNWHSDYPGYLGTIFDVWEANQRTYSIDIYTGMRRIWKNEIYNRIFPQIRRLNPNLDSLALDQIVTDSSNARWPTYLENDYLGGMRNYNAQTRIWSSYGFLQMVYFYATTDRGYDINDSNLPENLMITDSTFKFGITHLIDQFHSTLINEDYMANTGWESGYDQTLKFALRRYNNSAYANRVANKIALYLPKKIED